jgi:hypothetical protein
LACLRFPHLVNVRKVTRPSRAKLRGDQVFTRNEARPQIARLVNNVLKPPLPGRVEIDTGNCCENIDADRLAPYTKERAGFGKVGEGQACKRRSELRERRKNRVRFRRPLSPEYRGLLSREAARRWQPHKLRQRDT